jgi:hypothetical protein
LLGKPRIQASIRGAPNCSLRDIEKQRFCAENGMQINQSQYTIQDYPREAPRKLSGCILEDVEGLQIVASGVATFKGGRVQGGFAEGYPTGGKGRVQAEIN